MSWFSNILQPFATIGAGALDFFGQSSANSANRAMSNQQMHFQEMMSNTAYQRAVADMRKAGINPMLAYMQGGASSPSGNSIPAVNEFSGAVSSALSAKRTAAEVSNMFETNKKIKSDIRLNNQLIQTSKADAKLKNASSALAAANAANEATRLPGLQFEADMDRSIYGKSTRAVSRAGGAVGSVGGGLIGGLIGKLFGGRSSSNSAKSVARPVPYFQHYNGR